MYISHITSTRPLAFPSVDCGKGSTGISTSIWTRRFLGGRSSCSSSSCSSSASLRSCRRLLPICSSSSSSSSSSCSSTPLSASLQQRSMYKWIQLTCTFCPYCSDTVPWVFLNMFTRIVVAERRSTHWPLPFGRWGRWSLPFNVRDFVFRAKEIFKVALLWFVIWHWGWNI